MSGFRKQTAGFTLLELLIVIVIIAILFAIIMPSVFSLKQKARIRQAGVEVNAVAMAIRGYHTEYGEWPVSPSTGGVWSNYNGRVLYALTKPGNTKGINFMETTNVTDAASLKDPFKTMVPYVVTIDVAGNSVTVYSAGPNGVYEYGKPTGNGDDIWATH
jgi:type II secretion system protein G